MLRRTLCSALLLALANTASAGGFTYRGQLLDEGKAADGRYDLQFHLYADREGRRLLAGPIEMSNVAVDDGRFAVALELPSTFAATGWLEVAVKSSEDATFWPLGEKESVSLEAGTCPATWELTGNAGTLPGTNFLGTTDNQPLVLRSFNQAVATIQAVEVDPGIFSANLRFGSPANTVNPAAEGATIAGGGSTSEPNLVRDNFGTVGGGIGNRAGSDSASATDATGATVAGGTNNSASGAKAAVGGGNNNNARGDVSAIGGGTFNLADGLAGTIGGGSLNYALGTLSTVAGGGRNTAAGDESFVAGGDSNCAGAELSWAGGQSAKVRPSTALPGTGEGCQGVATTATGDFGTFAWADSQAVPFVSSGPDQFLIRARGGMSINAPPIADAVELSITADADDSDFANLFLRQRSNNAGVLLSAGGATSVGANDAALFFDQFNGTAQLRRLSLEGDGDLVVTAGAFKPGGGSWAASSDARLKRDIQPLEGALDRLMRLQGVSFEYTHPDSAKRRAGRHDGFVAQQVAQEFPAWVATDGEGYLTVAPQGFEALTVEALRDLQVEFQATLAEQQAALEALRAEVAQLRRTLAATRAASME